MYENMISLEESTLDRIIKESNIDDGLILIKTNYLSDYVIQSNKNIKYYRLKGLRFINDKRKAIGILSENGNMQNEPFSKDYFVGKKLVIESEDGVYLSGKIECVSIISESKLEVGTARFKGGDLELKIQIGEFVDDPMNN